MNRIVVDASVAMKWFVPEVHSDAAVRLQSPNYELCGPDLLYVECGNIVWKKVRRGELEESIAREIMQTLLLLPLEIHPALPIAEASLEIALTTGCTVYDSLYLALATSLDAVLVTADRKLYNRVTPTPLGNVCRWVEDVS